MSLMSLFSYDFVGVNAQRVLLILALGVIFHLSWSDLPLVWKTLSHSTDENQRKSTY
jgi:hypothetical protein